METPAAHRALLSARRPAIATLTPDQHAWQQFIHQPTTLTWIRGLIRSRYGNRLSENRADTLLATAWIALATSDRYRIDHGSPIAFAQTLVRRAWVTAYRERHLARQRVERLDDVAEHLDPIWACDHLDQQRRLQRQNQADVREALPLLSGEAKRWAETFLAVLCDLDAPTTVVSHQRSDPFLQTQQRLGWTRYAADQARMQVLCARHLRRLAPLRPQP